MLEPQLSPVTLGPKCVPQSHQFVHNTTEYYCLERLGQISRSQRSFRTFSDNLGSKPGASVEHTDTEAW